MRIGIFGGSFDPVHYGHLLLAETCRESCQLDEVRLVPAAVPPHKQGHDRAAGLQRLEMLKLAVGGHPALTVWDIELQRGGVSYTIDTLRVLRDESPAAEIFLLMGADSVHDLPNWREPLGICELACLLVVARPGCGDVNIETLNRLRKPEHGAPIRHRLVEMPQIDLASTDIRKRVSARRSIRYRTPRAVEKYIETEGLYAQ